MNKTLFHKTDKTLDIIQIYSGFFQYPFNDNLIHELRIYAF